MSGNDTSYIVFAIPDDPDLLAAFGRVSLHHSHLDYILRMTVKTLTGVSPAEALDATSRDSSATLRKRIRTLARRRLGEGSALVRLQALLERCRRTTAKRNDFVHSIWARELDGEAMMRNEDHSWRKLPTIVELDDLSREIRILLNELNEARLQGFLAEELSEKGANSNKR